MNGAKNVRHGVNGANARANGVNVRINGVNRVKTPKISIEEPAGDRPLGRLVRLYENMATSRHLVMLLMSPHK